MLRVCSSFERRIISVCKTLADSGFFENFDKELTPTMKAMVEDFTGREVQNLSYWEIVGLVEKLDDMVSNVYEDRNESDSIFSTLRDITADELYKCRQELPWLIARLKKMRGTPTFIFSSPTFVVR